MKTAYFCLSADTRKKIFVVIKILSLVSVALSILYLGLVFYSFTGHRVLLRELIISLFDDLYKNLITLGFLLLLVSVVCFKLNKNLKNQPTNHSLPRTHRVWVGLLLLTLLVTATCASLMTRVEAVVDAEVGPRLKHGLSHYMDIPSWGSALDHVQSHLQCCGVHGPADWYATTWIPMDRLTGHNVDYKLVQPNGRVQVPLVPTSCCRVVSAECGHRAWMETKTRSWGDIKPADVSLLHAVGCEEAIRYTVARDILILKIILLIVFILQIVLVAFSRLLYTSTLNSVMLGRPKEKAPAWLVGPRLFHSKKRYGYLQEYDDRCQHVETGERVDLKTHKQRFRCLAKLPCNKSPSGIDSEVTDESSEGRRRNFRSPCLAKLKSPCMEKIKASCSKKLKKKKNKSAENTVIKPESDMSSEEEARNENSNETVRKSSKERKSNLESLKTSGRKKIPGIRNPNEQQNNHSSKQIVRKKLSGNLIDVEDVVEVMDVYETRTNQVTPFSVKYGEENTPKSPLKVKGTTRGNSYKLEPRKHASGVVKDFKKRRELFENAAKIESKTGPGTGEILHYSIGASLQYPSNLIDLDGIESVKSLLSKGVTSGTIVSDITSLSSGKNEVKHNQVVLRNYPPLSPLE